MDYLENFIIFLQRRLTNEIYFEFNKLKDEKDLSSEMEIEIILHFLAKIEEYLVLYGTQIKIKKPSNSIIDQEVINELNNIFNKVDPNISLIKGRIKEIFLSYSS